MTLKFKMGLTDDITRDALLVSVILGLFAFIGVGDNLLVFRTLARYKAVRIGLFALAGGLALADVCSLVIGVPVGVLYELKKFDFLDNSEPFCKTEGYLSHSFSYIAAYHLVAFAVLRAIVLTSRSRTGPTFNQGLLCSILLWGLALIANIPMLTSFGEETTEENTALSLCLMRFDYTDEKFLFLTLGFSFALPVVLIVLIYFFTYLVCRRFCEDSFSEHQVQFSKLVTAVICVFVACWLPVNVLHMVILYKNQAVDDILLNPVWTPEQDRMLDKLEVLYVVRDYFIGIAHLDKFIRPIIYATMSKDFNKSFDEIVNCKVCFKRQETGGNCTSTTPLAGIPDACVEEIL